MHELWTEKFFPKNFGEFVDNSEIAEKAAEWARNWDKGKMEPPLLLWGQTGAGKTALAYLIAEQFKWAVVELNSSDLRSKEAIDRVAGAASQNASFFGGKRLVLLDEVDSMAREDRGGIAAISAVIKDSRNPVIITANDIFENRSLSALRFVCKTFEFKKINYLSIAKRLKEILSSEKIGFEEEAVAELAKNSSGDMRSALLDLQTLALPGKVSADSVKSLSLRERQQNVFSVMKAIFKGTDFSEVRDARMQSDLASDMLFRWVEENIPRQYSSAQDISLAFDRLSRADIFNGRIYRKQHWGFLKYSSELSGEGVALSKEKVSHDFVMYQFPQLLSMLSKTSSLRALKKDLGLKIGAKTHSSSRAVISKDLPYYREIFSGAEKAVAFTAFFGLNEKEVAFLLNSKPETKKVQKIISEAAKISVENARPKFFSSFSARAGNEPEAPLSDEEEPESHEESDSGKGGQTRLF